MAGIGRRPSEDAIRERLHAYADEWLDIAGSTQPADRPRAEAAILDLYRRAGQTAPEILWVPSPGSAVAAYVLANDAHRHPGAPFVPPVAWGTPMTDLDSASGRFGIDAEWALRLVRRALALLPEDLAARVANPDTTDPVALAFSIGRATGVGDTGIAARLLQVELVDGRTAADVAELERAVRRSDPAGVDAAAAGVLGPAWERIVATVGLKLARDLYRRATVALASDLLGDVGEHREVARLMRPGQFDALTPVLAMVREVGRRPLWRTMLTRDAHDAVIDARLALARSAGPWWILPELAIVCERPSRVRRDDRARLHSASGPALEYADGMRVYAWHGVRVPREVIDSPESITVASIEAERNAEVRRAMIERFGEERFVQADGGEVIASDATGRLWRRRSSRPSSRWGGPPQDEPIVMVEVLNATPEPDGSRRTYFLRVPPTMQTAREAVAWTFGMAGEAWRPAAES